MHYMIIILNFLLDAFRRVRIIVVDFKTSIIRKFMINFVRINWKRKEKRRMKPTLSRQHEVRATRD